MSALERDAIFRKLKSKADNKVINCSCYVCSVPCALRKRSLGAPAGRATASRCRRCKGTRALEGTCTPHDVIIS